MNERRKLPNVVFLDAVGTLFGVKGSVGAIYAEVAQQFGVVVPASTLNRSFFQSFRAGGMPAFGDVDRAEIPAREFEWWLEIATNTFQQAGVLEQFPDFTEFFAVLYAHFATAAPWIVYPDVLPALKRWQQLGVPLGILSNFDSRLYAVLETLALADFFASLTISTEAGAAKPDARIFAIALQKHNCLPSGAWHIGDSFEEDYQAAKAAGMRGIWLRRK
ncbi:MAG: HAD-IA family hydrolase [Stenomitos frigidus ULC029]